MRFIVDESTGTAVAEYLRAAGHDVLAIAEATPGALDSEVLDLAANENRLLITNDKDFGELVFRSGRTYPGVLLLRIRNEAPSTRVRVVAAVLEVYADQLAGNFVVATEKMVRVRTRT